MTPMPAEGQKEDTGSMVIRSLAYSYPGGKEILSDFSLELPPGSRCLLSGANGAGKTTLLQILAGKTMVPEDAVRVIGKPPFHDINLTCSGELGYLGSQWRRTIGSAVRPSDYKKAKRLFFFALFLLSSVFLCFPLHSPSTSPHRRTRILHLTRPRLDVSFLTAPSLSLYVHRRLRSFFHRYHFG